MIRRHLFHGQFCRRHVDSDENNGFYIGKVPAANEYCKRKSRRLSSSPPPSGPSKYALTQPQTPSRVVECTKLNYGASVNATKMPVPMPRPVTLQPCGRRTPDSAMSAIRPRWHVSRHNSQASSHPIIVLSANIARRRSNHTLSATTTTSATSAAASLVRLMTTMASHLHIFVNCRWWQTWTHDEAESLMTMVTCTALPHLHWCQSVTEVINQSVNPPYLPPYLPLFCLRRPFKSWTSPEVRTCIPTIRPKAFTYSATAQTPRGPVTRSGDCISTAWYLSLHLRQITTISAATVASVGVHFF